MNFVSCMFSMFDWIWSKSPMRFTISTVLLRILTGVPPFFRPSAISTTVTLKPAFFIQKAVASPAKLAPEMRIFLLLFILSLKVYSVHIIYMYRRCMDASIFMSTPLDRRSRKRLATRQAISDAATRLFHKRGFDQVTVDEIAEAADVGRMTVFTHSPRKEDIFFDLDEYVREELILALQQRDPGVPPIEALRQFAHRAFEE